METKKRSKQLKAPKGTQVEVTAQHLYWLRGLLMARERNEVSWDDICARTGVSRRMLAYILAGRHRGGLKTLNALLRLREQGLMIHLSDFQR